MICRDISGYGKLIALAVGLLILGNINGCSNWTKENITESQRRGNEIISALEVYRAKNQSYPTKLQELVPVYLSEIKPPLSGNKQWEYVNEGKGFYLGFGDDPDADPVCYFAYSLKEWVMDTR